ncbi:patatin-like phospholipase family protein [Denitrobaculum tricleocarpae]|nr:patatin-like phospholipase family protein [Denitrobaculum tricleocarpae]
MKGGITSGVVYPHAIAEIAEEYRLHNLGGTSAGAIGAVMASAAEYRRQDPDNLGTKAGFDEIRELSRELGQDMRSLFQASPQLQPLFDILMSVVEKPKSKSTIAALLPAVLRAYKNRVAIGVGLGAAVVAAGIMRGELWLAVLGVFLGIAAGVVLVVLALKTAIFGDLPDHDFGLCPGLRTSGNLKPGLTDWIADKIDSIANNLNAAGKPETPLTVGQLNDRDINVATMTTDLSSRRPYQLPLKSRHHLFSVREMMQVLPERVVDHLVKMGERLEHKNPAIPDDLYHLPIGRDFPVVLVARMSLSFPGLIRAVPLYRFDDQLKVDGDNAKKIRRCLFSDGGISSNFPIHFFDALLPRRPTFGISLTSFDKARHNCERVHLPSGVQQSTNLPIQPITGILGFLGSIVNTAKDWQDSLQSLMPGYAERIVEIRLDDSAEGGMNLDMSPETICCLSKYGRQAGQLLLGNFKMNEHRYLRAISLLKTTEGDLEKFANSYDAAPDGAEATEPTYKTYKQIFCDYQPEAYRNTETWRCDVLGGLAKALADIGTKAKNDHAKPGNKSVRKGSLPSFDARLRLVASADRIPEHAQAITPSDGGDKE